MLAFEGRKISMRDPNFMMPNRPPAGTASPILARQALRITEKKREERTKREKRDRQTPGDGRAGKQSCNERADDERRARRVEAQLRVLHAMAAQNAFHPVFQVQFLFFEGDFFDAF